MSTFSKAYPSFTHLHQLPHESSFGKTSRGILDEISKVANDPKAICVEATDGELDDYIALLMRLHTVDTSPKDSLAIQVFTAGQQMFGPGTFVPWVRTISAVLEGFVTHPGSRQRVSFRDGKVIVVEGGPLEHTRYLDKEEDPVMKELLRVKLAQETKDAVSRLDSELSTLTPFLLNYKTTAKTFPSSGIMARCHAYLKSSSIQVSKGYRSTNFSNGEASLEAEAICRQYRIPSIDETPHSHGFTDNLKPLEELQTLSQIPVFSQWFLTVPHPDPEFARGFFRFGEKQSVRWVSRIMGVVVEKTGSDVTDIITGFFNESMQKIYRHSDRKRLAPVMSRWLGECENPADYTERFCSLFSASSRGQALAQLADVCADNGISDLVGSFLSDPSISKDDFHLLPFAIRDEAVKGAVTLTPHTDSDHNRWLATGLGRKMFLEKVASTLKWSAERFEKAAKGTDATAIMDVDLAREVCFTADVMEESIKVCLDHFHELQSRCTEEVEQVRAQELFGHLQKAQENWRHGLQRRMADQLLAF